ncbi:NAD(P)/FAD-dependent oxidoreductase [Curvivirga sp.]|uniref:NAD(P)/FAD-dependent oxidoreductase n=1 Tax=Curvivirga sp. TaxID=2856848 RepID=UPI003B5C8B3E
MDHIAIIGAGQAGYSVATNLRNHGFDGKISIYGAEDAAPYERPPLSKNFLMGNIDSDGLLFRDDAFYQEQNIDLFLEAEIDKIEVGANRFKYQDDWVHYDHLVLATGSNPKTLPDSLGGALDGLFYLRHLKDAKALKTKLSDIKNLLVIGGGFIGLEIAAVAAEQGLSVTVVEMGDRILQRAIGSSASDCIRKIHQDHGVSILECTSLQQLVGDVAGHVCKAILSDGKEISTDAVIVGIGASPETRLAANAGLLLDNGIRVNEFGQTSVGNIWAAGDCTSFPLSDDFIRLESVQNAVDQGEVVARNIMGQNLPYKPVPWFWTEQYDSRLQIVGLQDSHNQCVMRPGKKDESLSYWYFRERKLQAVEVFNDPKTYMLAKKIIEANKLIDPVSIADPATNLKKL